MNPREKSERKRIIAERIRMKKQERGLTQRELADACEITEVTISRYMHAQRVPDTLALIAIADALDCTVDYLLGRDARVQADGSDRDTMLERINALPVVWSAEDEPMYRCADVRKALKYKK